MPLVISILAIVVTFIVIGHARPKMVRITKNTHQLLVLQKRLNLKADELEKDFTRAGIKELNVLTAEFNAFAKLIEEDNNRLIFNKKITIPQLKPIDPAVFDLMENMEFHSEQAMRTSAFVANYDPTKMKDVAEATICAGMISDFAESLIYLIEHVPEHPMVKAYQEKGGTVEHVRTQLSAVTKAYDKLVNR